MEAYLLEVGVLLTPEDEEFNSYNSAYNKKFGFYDESQSYEKEKDAAINLAKAYVAAGVERTYAVISKTWIPNNFDFETDCVEDETYELEDVIYSIAKFDGDIIEDFLKKDREELLKNPPITPVR